MKPYKTGEHIDCIVVNPAEPEFLDSAVPGSRFDHTCSRCGRKVMLAPSGQRILEQTGASLVCLHCFQISDVDHDTEIFTPPSNELRQELGQWLASRGSKTPDWKQ